RPSYPLPWRIYAGCRPAQTAASASCSWPLLHQAHAAAYGDHLVALVQAGVLKLDDTCIRPGGALTFADDLGARSQGIACENRFGKTNVAHAKITYRRAKCRVLNRHADHDGQRVKAVEQRFAPLGLFREMIVDVQWLRVQRHQAE